MQFKLNQSAKHSYKIGMEEIEGLEHAMRQAFEPVLESIAGRIYWYDKDRLISKAEYKSRDGFIPHSDNYGGLEIQAIIPSCER